MKFTEFFSGKGKPAKKALNKENNFYAILFISSARVSGRDSRRHGHGRRNRYDSAAAFIRRPQKIAQSANLFAFLPTGACALNVHMKNGLLQKDNAVKNAIPALVAAAAGSLLALALPAEFLRKTFGLFLVILALFTFSKNKD